MNYKNKDVLTKLYWIEDKTIEEIGDLFDVSRSTISYWMGKFAVPVANGDYENQVYHDENLLRELYHEESLSAQKIANRAGVSKNTIYNWLEEHDIERRTPTWEKPPSYHETTGGYKAIKTQHGDEQYWLSVHRLTAVAEHGYDEVVDRHVHHLNGHKFDNRPENLKPVTPEEHNELHRNDDPLKHSL